MKTVVMNVLQTLLQPLTARVSAFQWQRAPQSATLQNSNHEVVRKTTEPVEFYGTADHQARAKRAAQYTSQPSRAGAGYVAYTAPSSIGRPAHELLRTSTPLEPRPLRIRAQRYSDQWVWQRSLSEERFPTEQW